MAEMYHSWSKYETKKWKCLLDCREEMRICQTAALCRKAENILNSPHHREKRLKQGLCVRQSLILNSAEVFRQRPQPEICLLAKFSYKLFASLPNQQELQLNSKCFVAMEICDICMHTRTQNQEPNIMPWYLRQSRCGCSCRGEPALQTCLLARSWGASAQPLSHPASLLLVNTQPVKNYAHTAKRAVMCLLFKCLEMYGLPGTLILCKHWAKQKYHLSMVRMTRENEEEAIFHYVTHK